MVLVEDRDFYIAVGVISGALLVTIILVIVLFVIVTSLRKQLKLLNSGPKDKYENYKIRRAHLRSNDYAQFPAVPNMYGSEDVDVQNHRVIRNPLANQNNFGKNPAVIEELKRGGPKQTSHQQQHQQTPPQASSLHQQLSPPPTNHSRPPARGAYDIDNKNFFY